MLPHVMPLSPGNMLITANHVSGGSFFHGLLQGGEKTLNCFSYTSAFVSLCECTWKSYPEVHWPKSGPWFLSLIGHTQTRRSSFSSDVRFVHVFKHTSTRISYCEISRCLFALYLLEVAWGIFKFLINSRNAIKGSWLQRLRKYECFSLWVAWRAPIAIHKS